MSNNTTVLSSPGFRFYPTEEELLTFYLHNKLENRREADMARVIPVADIYSVDPWQLPQMSGEPCIRDSEQWFFFCRRQEREAHGGRPTRTTPSGYWKATGSPTDVYSSASHRVIGVKKTMVFYTGRAPTGTKTKWKMNEYRATCDQDQHANTSDCGAPKLRNEFSLCRVYVKSSCLRSFDRRPPAAGAAAIASRRAAPEAESSGAKRARLHDGGSSSSSSSASGGDNGSSAPRGEAPDDLKVLDEVDWEAFDWF